MIIYHFSDISLAEFDQPSTSLQSHVTFDVSMPQAMQANSNVYYQACFEAATTSRDYRMTLRTIGRPGYPF
jgi:hypothetical protein